MVPLNATRKRQLSSDANRLKAQITVSADSVSDAVIEHVRNAFRDRELVKIRIHAADRAACDAAARLIAERAPCQLVKRVGKVATFYRVRIDNGRVSETG